MEDETTKVFLNPHGIMKDVDTELENFLQYLANGKPLDHFTNQLEKEVIRARENEEWRCEYMTLMMREKEKYEEGREEGTLMTLFALVKKDLISLKEAAEEAGISEELFVEKMQQAGEYRK